MLLVDFSVVKDTKAKFLGEGGNIEFRTEIFNVLNHPNFGAPNATIWSPSSPGVLTSYNGNLGTQILPAGTQNTSCAAGSTAAPISCAVGATSNLAAFNKAGQITNTNTTSRQIQFSLKILF
jgi:hypothetical protein